MRSWLVRWVKQVWTWFDERTGVGGLLIPIAKHRVPPGSRWAYVLGSATLFAFMLQVVTGISLALSYVPASANAYESLQYITHQAPLGNLLRALHYFGASAMVILIGLHALRVYLYGSYKYPREVGWLTGVVLLFLTIAMGFTGQLLRWDQDGVWSVIVGAEQAGRVPFIGPWVARFVLAGDTVGGATLSRFFAFHVFFVPAVIFGCVGFHLWLVLRNGISEPPQPGRPVDPKTYKHWYEAMLKREGLPFWPDAAWRDVVFGVAMLAVVLACAVYFGPPELTSPPDPTLLHANPRPDWYLLWYFAILALLPEALERYFMVYGPLAFAILMFTLPFLRPGGERSWLRRPWAMAAVLVVVLMIATLWRLGVLSPWSPDFSAQPLPSVVVGVATGPVADGGRLFNTKGCEYCHTVSGFGGHRGPDLTSVGDRLTESEMTLRIMNGGQNMPAFASGLTHEELTDLVIFLQSRRASLH